MSNYSIDENQTLDGIQMMLASPAFRDFEEYLETTRKQWDSVAHIKASGKSHEYAEGFCAGIDAFLGLRATYEHELNERMK
jgi:hypothetical protein